MGEAFGGVSRDTCEPTSEDPAPVSLDTSLQVKVSVQNVLQYNDVNSCAVGETISMEMPAMPTRHSNAPRVSRGGE